jgi:hypothetical protein
MIHSGDSHGVGIVAEVSGLRPYWNRNRPAVSPTSDTRLRVTMHKQGCYYMETWGVEYREQENGKIARFEIFTSLATGIEVFCNGRPCRLANSYFSKDLGSFIFQDCLTPTIMVIRSFKIFVAIC